MSRILAREYFFKLVFEYQFLLQKDNEYFSQIFEDEKLTDEDKQYIENSYDEILKNKNLIDDIIKNYLKEYTIERLYKIDLAILRVAVFELKFSSDQLPNSVIIDSAVELAKKYSTDNSYKFINGILASVVRGEDGAKTTN